MEPSSLRLPAANSGTQPSGALEGAKGVGRLNKWPPKPLHGTSVGILYSCWGK